MNSYGSESMRIESGAVISPCERYRYSLWRTWDPAGARVLFICLNPSTADGSTDDQTVRRCVSFAKRWGFGSLAMGNLFALRATDPRELRAATDPVGPENDAWLKRLWDESAEHVAAWGIHGSLFGRGEEVRASFSGFKCLGVTTAGHPRHPLFVRGNKPLEPFGGVG